MNATLRKLVLLWLSAPSVLVAQPAPDLDARFASSNGWIGADGIYSASLPKNRTAWLFSDTWTGEVQDNRRMHPRMINNSVGITEGLAPARFYYSTNANGKAVSLFTPPDGRGWYWLWSALPSGNTLCLFAARVERTAAGGAFGFRVFGTALGEIANPQEVPTVWRVRWQNLPEAWQTNNVFWGSAALHHQGFAYVFGYLENGGKGADFRRQMLIARAPGEKLNRFSEWRFYGSGAWLASPQAAEPVCPDVATEYSVTYHSVYQKFLLVTHDSFLSPTIVARLSDHPWGPWSDKKTLFTCPEADPSRGIFCYAAKLHPSLSDDQRLVISYAANANDMATVLNDNRLYRPRFIRLPARDLFNR